MQNMFTTTTDAAMRDNIRSSWNRADAHCRDQGLDWYPAINRLVHALADAADIDPTVVAGIVAVLSPRASWGSNVKNAAATLVEAGHLDAAVASAILKLHGYDREPAELHTPTGLGGSLAKARAIADSENPGPYVAGQKVLSFFHNIADPAGSDDVTIDSWAAGVTIGRRLSTAEMSGLTPAQYRRVADQYRAVAVELNMVPSTLQAACWCEIRGRSR